jgi:N-acetyl-gamma-glutamyl-phosphate reductase
MKKAIIIGATGFGGLGLVDILLKHPGIEVIQLIARRDVGQPISKVFPHLKGFCEMMVEDIDKINYSADIAFFSTPDRAGMTIIKEFIDRKIPVIDFSGDFRFRTEAEYSIYAKNKGMDDKHLFPSALTQTVYGLPEINAEAIRKAKLIGNPGCFAVSMILGLLPAVEQGMIKSDTIICDGKTGVSGAGKNPGESNFYPQRYEDVNTYREGKHQHIVEVENVLNDRSSKEYRILFVPQIVPLNRGILTTIYADAKEGLTAKDVHDGYRNYYRNCPFIQITESSPHTTDVRGSNRCEIRPAVDARTGKIFITSVIDNLMKGQSGNAVQCANIILGFDETAGLNAPGFYP